MVMTHSKGFDRTLPASLDSASRFLRGMSVTVPIADVPRGNLATVRCTLDPLEML